MCSSPYLNSKDDFAKNIASIEPMAGFPYLCTAEQGSPTGRFNFQKNVQVYNNGDIETYCKVIMDFKGEVLNPKFYVNSNYVRIIDTLATNDQIIIDFTKRPPAIHKNGSNINFKCDKQSNFFGMQLNIGDNTIGFDADSGDDKMDVTVFYNNLYSTM